MDLQSIDFPSGGYELYPRGIAERHVLRLVHRERQVAAFLRVREQVCWDYVSGIYNITL